MFIQSKVHYYIAGTNSLNKVVTKQPHTFYTEFQWSLQYKQQLLKCATGDIGNAYMALEAEIVGDLLPGLYIEPYITHIHIRIC